MLFQILVWFAGIAIVLSLIGVYGLASDTVARRNERSLFGWPWEAPRARWFA